MNLLIKSISISLLSLLGMDTALAESGIGQEIGPVQYAGNPSMQESRSHIGRQYGNVSWEGHGDGPAAMQREWSYPSASGRSDENRLTPEQRQALRHEIREVGRELYRQK